MFKFPDCLMKNIQIVCGVDVEETILCLRGRGSAVMKPYLILGVDNWKHCQFIAFYSDFYNF